MEKTELETLFKEAKTTFKSSRESRYEAIAKTFIWLVEARKNENYIKDRESVKDDDVIKENDDDDKTDNIASDNWETHSLKAIFGFTNIKQRSQLSKYKAIFAKLEKNKAWIKSDKFATPEEQDVTDFIIEHGGISRLATSEGKAKTGDKKIGQQYYDDLVAGKLKDKNPYGKFTVETAVDATQTKLVTMLCRVDGNDIQVLEKLGDVDEKAIKAKGTAIRVKAETTLSDDVLFWKNFWNGIKLSGNDAVIRLEDDGKTLVVSNHLNDDPVVAPIFKCVSHREWSDSGVAHQLKKSEIEAVIKLLKDQVDALAAEFSTDDDGGIVVAVGEKSETIALPEDDVKPQIRFVETVEGECKEASMSFDGKLDDLLDKLVLDLRDMCGDGIAPNVRKPDRTKTVGLLKGQKDVKVIMRHNSVIFEGSHMTITLPAWDDNSYIEDDMVAAG